MSNVNQRAITPSNCILSKETCLQRQAPLKQIYYRFVRKEKLSGPVRHALALCGELDEEDPYYLARRSMTSTRDVGEDYFDGDDDEVVMTPRDRKATSQRRYYEEDEEPIVMQQSHRYVTSQSRRWDDEDESVVPTRINTSRMRRDVDEEDAYPEIRQRSRASTDLMFENDKLPGRVQRSRKRDYSDDTNKSYTMPVSRRCESFTN